MMDYKFLYHRIKYIILNPVKAWDVILFENRPIKYVRGSFFFPLIILVAVSAFLGSIFFTHSELSEVYSVLVGIKYLLLMYISVYATVFLLREITNALDLGRDFTISFKLTAYSVAPFLLCQIISRSFESFIFINVLALYGLFIFWTGSEKLLNPPEHKKMPLLIAVTAGFSAIFILANWLLTQVLDRFYFTFFA